MICERTEEDEHIEKDADEHEEQRVDESEVGQHAPLIESNKGHDSWDTKKSIKHT